MSAVVRRRLFFINALLNFSWDPALPRVRQQQLFQHHLRHVSCHTYRVQDHHLPWVTATRLVVYRIFTGSVASWNIRTVFTFPSFLSVKVNVPNSLISLTVSKNCSLLLSCITPPNTETEWSVNRGFDRESHTQICCMTDNCNLQTLAGKICSSLLSHSCVDRQDVSPSQMSQWWDMKGQYLDSVSTIDTCSVLQYSAPLGL